VRKVLVAIAVLGILAAMPASASAAGPTKAQFNALKAKVNVLQTRVSELEGAVEDAAALLVYHECVANALQWDALDLIFTAAGVDPGPPYNDNGACAAIGITRPRSLQALEVPTPSAEMAAKLRALTALSRR
jgi:hypothetical protein